MVTVVVTPWTPSPHTRAVSNRGKEVEGEKPRTVAVGAFVELWPMGSLSVYQAGSSGTLPTVRGELKAAGNGDVESVLGVAGLTCCDTLKAGHAVWPVLPPAPKRGRGSVAASKQNSYALDQLYKRFCGRRSNAHHAEQDCIDLMKVCHTVKGAFLNYVDGSAKLLADSRSAW